MEFLKGVVKKYTETSLIIRIVIGLVAGAFPKSRCNARMGELRAMRREGDPSTTLAFARSARDVTWPCRCAPYRVTHDRVFAESADPVTERYFDSWQTGCLARGSRGTVFRLVAGRECHKSKYRSFSLRW